jgi:DMSO/TMAO reductase YedYZ molybdopterin-dependent catalytic subunit
MAKEVSRRQVLKGGMALAGIAALGIPEWMIPALAQGEELVPFTDVPADFVTNPKPGVRYLDTRKIESFLTPSDQFFTVQHYGQPVVDPTSYELKIGGLVEHPMELSLSDLKKRPRVEYVAGFECSGNSQKRISGLAGNARWLGAGLASLLNDCGLQRQAKEVVFFGADKGNEEVSHGGGTATVEQRFARSLALQDAVSPEILVAYEMNGEPLSLYQGAPVRLIVPGWYGVANIKWLEHILVLDRRFMGKFMAREYVTLRGEKVSDEIIWNETSVSKMQLTSAVVRVTRKAGRYQILGFAITDGTSLKSVEVRIDNGEWQSATIDPSSTSYSWKLFTIPWESPAKGEHTLASRAIDINGKIQPTEEDLGLKKTRWENNGQIVRRVLIS